MRGEGNQHVPARSAGPPSLRVLEALRARIEAGEWQAGNHMPTTRELAGHYGVSTRTVAKAYATLAREGWVVVTPNWGTHRSDQQPWNWLLLG